MYIDLHLFKARFNELKRKRLKICHLKIIQTRLRDFGDLRQCLTEMCLGKFDIS